MIYVYTANSYREIKNKMAASNRCAYRRTQKPETTEMYIGFDYLPSAVFKKLGIGFCFSSQNQCDRSLSKI